MPSELKDPDDDYLRCADGAYIHMYLYTMYIYDIPTLYSANMATTQKNGIPMQI